MLLQFDYQSMSPYVYNIQPLLWYIFDPSFTMEKLLMFIGAHDLFVAELQPLFELGVYIFQSRYLLESPLSSHY